MEELEKQVLQLKFRTQDSSQITSWIQARCITNGL